MNKQDKALATALGEKDLTAAEAALKDGANPNLKIDGLPLVVSVAVTGTAEMVKLLLAYGADKDAVSNDNRTALGWLSSLGTTSEHLKIADVLIEAKADLEIADVQGARPFDRALEMRNQSLADRLQAAGAVLTSRADRYMQRNSREGGQQQPRR